MSDFDAFLFDPVLDGPMPRPPSAELVDYARKVLPVLASLPRTFRRGEPATIAFRLYSTRDHITPATGACAMVMCSRDGGPFVYCVTPPREVGHGWYTLTLTTDEIDAEVVVVHVAAESADPVDLMFYVHGPEMSPPATVRASA